MSSNCELSGYVPLRLVLLSDHFCRALSTLKSAPSLLPQPYSNSAFLHLPQTLPISFSITKFVCYLHALATFAKFSTYYF